MTRKLLAFAGALILGLSSMASTALAHETAKGHPKTVADARTGDFGEVLETYEENGSFHMVLDQDGFPGISPSDMVYIDDDGDGTFDRHEAYW